MTDGLMTVGDLARRSGMSAKLIRRFTDVGLIYSPGRSEANYRMYDESALWCVQAISSLRALGLTLVEIEAIGSVYINEPDADVASLLEEYLLTARRRLDSKLARLEEAKTRQKQVLTGSGGLTELVGEDPTRS